MNKSLLFFFIGMILLWNTSARAAGLVMSEDVNELFQNFRAIMPHCTDRIWSDYTWKGTEVIVVDANQDSAWKWNVSNDSFTQIAVENLPEAYTSSLYWYGNLGSTPTLILADDSRDRFLTGAHEFFHFLIQKKQNWKRNQSGLRGTFYPVSAQPRLYRHLLFQRLQEYFLTSNQTALGKAKFWYDKWVKEFPEEAKASMDLIEGTARYAEYMAESLLYIGCEASDSSLKEDLKGLVKDYLGTPQEFKYFSLDLESYSLGAIGALILRFENLAPTWQSQAREGISPLEVLMSRVSRSQADTIPDSLKKEYEGIARSKNSQLGAKFNLELKNWNQPSMVRVAFNPDLLGTYTLSGMIIPREIPDTSLLHLDQAGHIKTQSADLSFAGTKVLFLDGDAGNPCGEKFSALVRSSDIREISANEFKISDMKLKGQVQGERKVDADGYTWLCVRSE